MSPILHLRQLHVQKACLEYITETWWFPLLLLWCSALECAIKSAMELGFKSKIETCNEHKDDCQLPLLYTKRKDDWTFIKESSWVKEETLEMRSFCCMYGKSVKVSRVQQIYKQRPGSLPLYC